MAKVFYAWGPTQTENQLVDFIELGKRPGWLYAADTRLAAQQLLALWQGTWHFKQQLDLAKKLSHKKIAAHVKESLPLFFEGVGRQRSG
jgi:AefR-like transcriptional repressor, C-terminal domain